MSKFTPEEIEQNKLYVKANPTWSLTEEGGLVRPNGAKSGLQSWHLGQFKDPATQKKMAEGRTRAAEERKRRKEAAMTGFGHSHLADPEAQAKLINRLYEWAIGDDIDMAKFAMKQLNEMGITKQPAEKPEADEPTAKENMSMEDATSILMRAQKEAMVAGKKNGDTDE